VRNSIRHLEADFTWRERRDAETQARKALSARDREEQAKRELVSLGLWCVALPAVVALACWLGGKLS
jgi:hypothetical protein